MAIWTEAQQKVIDTRDKNILVSAAAGSGKTAVLVERIIQRIMDKDNPIDVDKIMVVTFTNAAAGEMRDRILKAIERELEKDPDNTHLQKQQAYIHNAYITTIHSFCLNLVREHFNDIDLDPGVRVADPGEIELLKSDVVKEVLEEYYSKGNDLEESAFAGFVAQFEDRTGDTYLEEMILSLYKKAMGYPWPFQWLNHCIKMYEYENEEEFKNSPYVKLLHQYADGILGEILKEYHLMLEICANGGPYVYTDRLMEEKEQIEKLCVEQDYDKRRVRLNMEFARLPACKENVCSTELKEMVVNIRKNVKSDIEKLKTRIYSQNTKEAYEEIKKCHDIIAIYVDITKSFIEKFREKKKAKNLIDFDDFEHYAIEVLVAPDEDGSGYTPTETADELANDFEEIMVDEYQDSNLVQETILSALSKERFGRHNRFMVGDVKQSIYGFRGANPDIFVEKYHTYTSADNDTDYKIILDKNFRSRKGVITTTNFLFCQIMNHELGNIDYDEENRLYFGAVLPEPENEKDNIQEKKEEITASSQNSEDSRNNVNNESEEDNGENNEENTEENNEEKVSNEYKEYRQNEGKVRTDDRTELILINTKEQPDETMSSENSKDFGNTEKESTDEEEDMSATAFEAEAKVIAKRIKELTDREKGMSIYDKDIQRYRTLQYSDIVILLRNIGQNADSISSELTKEGIPFYMESKTGYFKSLEIRTIISYLKIIDNPTLDIPMAAVLKSPFVALNDEEIALVRAVCGKDISLYEDVEAYVKLYNNESEVNELNEDKADGLNEDKANESNEDKANGLNEDKANGLNEDKANGLNEDKANDLYGNDIVQLPVPLKYDRTLVQKLKKFLQQLNEFRDNVMFMSIYELICDILNKTNYCDFISAMPSGAQRLANIEMLKTKAATYENGSYKGLFNFIRYIEKMDKYNIDQGSPSIANDNDNTVRIMTIHKSKGLEFPVVFIANINKKFNFMDARKKSTLHAKLGIGMDYIDDETRVVTKNLIKFAINKQIELDTIEEELRLFYVACTRAKDKLIFTGGGVDEKRLMRMVTQRKNNAAYLGYGVVSQFTSYMDFITVPLARNRAFREIYDELGIEQPFENAIYQEDSNVEVRYMGMSDIFDNLVKEKYLEGVSTQALSNLDIHMVYSQPVREKLREVMNFQYLYEKQTKEHAKMSVSEIKKISYENDGETMLEEEAVRFDFMAEYLKSVSVSERDDDEIDAGEIDDSEIAQTESDKIGKNKSEPKEHESESNEHDMEKSQDTQEIINPYDKRNKQIDAAQRGTIYHTVFEHFDYNMEPTFENISAMLDRLEEKGIISAEERQCIWLKDFLTFTKTNLYQRMRRAYARGELYREAQFVVGFTQTEIEEFKRIAKIIGEEGNIVQPEQVTKSGDTILIQGIIDAYFMEDGKLVIIDYKTDNVSESDELIRHYYIQLELYKKAAEQIIGRSVAEKILYSTKLGREIALD